jgi:hypothetical protein
MSCVCDELNINENNNINISYNIMSNNQPNPPPASTPTVLSYFNIANAKSEFQNDLAEMILVFSTSALISYYQGDDILVACERGGFLFIGQYLGNFVSDAFVNALYFTSSSNMAQYAPLAVKFGVATSVFVSGNKHILGSQQPYSTLFGESAVASVVAHYGASLIQPSINNAVNDASSWIPQY